MDILNISVSASFIIMSVVIIRAVFIHKLPKKTFAILWAVVICRLMTPFSIPSRFNIWSIVDALGSALQKKTAVPDSLPLPVSDVLGNTTAAFTSDSIAETIMTGATNFMADSNVAGIADLPFFFWLWLAGLCVCVFFFLVTHLRSRKVYKTALPIENQFIRQWLSEHPLRRRIRVMQLDKIEAPLTYGIRKPVILLPKELDLEDKTRLSYILTHEYVHIKNFDTLQKWILAGTFSVHWFNPLVWVMYILANRDIELSCDEAVVRTYGEDFKSVYALTLIGLEEKRGSLACLSSCFSKNAVEERVLSIMKIKKMSFYRVSAALVAIISISMVFATTKAAPSVKESVAGELTAQSSGGAVFVNNLANGSILDNSKSPAVTAMAGNSNSANLDYETRMLFITKGKTDLKVTYDGATWMSYNPILEEEIWKWYSYEEYSEFIKLIMNSKHVNSIGGSHAGETDMTKYMRTLEDIKNGIRVSMHKTVFVLSEEGPPCDYYGLGATDWFCFGYIFEDKNGNLVDLGLYETRDGLFAALKQYYDNEVAEGNMPQTEADEMYNQIAHPIRYKDEVPLADKLRSIT